MNSPTHTGPLELIGMLDSPYVRRVAISLQLLGLPFRHRSISVFSTFAQFQAINPVVKAPTLVCADGVALMDSTLIVDHAESLAAPGRSLMPAGVIARRDALQAIGLALAACEKSVQILYEQTLRPEEKRHAPWIARVTGQLFAACDGLEALVRRWPALGESAPIDQAGVCAAVTWHFIQQMQPGTVTAERCPGLSALSAAAEALPAFRAAPHGAGTVSASA